METTRELILKTLLENPDCFDWDYLSQNKDFTIEELYLCRDFINWDLACQYQTIPEDYLQKYIGPYYSDIVSEHQNLSEEFMERNADNLNWDILSQYQKFSKQFMDKMIKRINWDVACQHQNILEPNGENKVDRCILTLQKIIDSFDNKKLDQVKDGLLLAISVLKSTQAND